MLSLIISDRFVFKDVRLVIMVSFLFPAFEMTLAEGTRFERRFFHQTFATVGFVLISVDKTGTAISALTLLVGP